MFNYALKMIGRFIQYVILSLIGSQDAYDEFKLNKNTPYDQIEKAKHEKYMGDSSHAPADGRSENL